MLHNNPSINRIMPVTGFGTWAQTGHRCAESTESAIQIGYRLIDVDQMYHNEEDVGRGIKNAGIDRSDLFVSTKLADKYLKPISIISSTMESLHKLDLDYIDLLLIHLPFLQKEMEACLESMLILRSRNIIKYIGVSNFGPELFLEAIETGEVSTNQVKFSPYYQQMKNLEIAKAHGKIITACNPLERGKISVDKTLTEIGKRHNKSAAQVTLRWLIQLGNVSVITKAAEEKDRIEYFEIFDFELTEDEMQHIHELDKSKILI